MDLTCEEAKILKFILKLNLKQKEKNLEFIKDNKLDTSLLNNYLINFKKQLIVAFNTGRDRIGEIYYTAFGYQFNNTEFAKDLKKDNPYILQIEQYLINKHQNNKYPHNQHLIKKYNNTEQKGGFTSVISSTRSNYSTPKREKTIEELYPPYIPSYYEVIIKVIEAGYVFPEVDYTIKYPD